MANITYFHNFSPLNAKLQQQYLGAEFLSVLVEKFKRIEKNSARKST